MKTILKIAGLELKLLFSSPVAWLVLIIFLYQFGDAFTQALGNPPNDVLRFYPGYTSWLFSSKLFPNLDNAIYLYIPLMTMGLMSQELSSGNIKLLFSSPVKTRSIILGKYFGIMGFWMIVIALLVLYSIPPVFMIHELDFGIVLPGILAVFLLACTYSAVGLFMSCLTTYQVVAALCTLTVLAALNYIGGLWQNIPVLKDVINFLHMAGHAQNMNWGFIKSKDILYFIIISILFLGLAILYLEDTIQSRTKKAKLKRYFIFTTVMIFLGCLFSLRTMTLYFDATASKFNTISPTSQAVLRKIKGPVRVTAYCNLLDRNGEYQTGFPENRIKDFNFWEPYIRFLPQLDLEYVNYYAIYDPLDWGKDSVMSPLKLDTMANRNALRSGLYIEDYLPPAKINKLIDLKPEKYGFVRTVEQGNKRLMLRVYKDVLHVPGEREILTAFSGLIADYPKIGFLTGHYERSLDEYEDRDYKLFANEESNRSSLINQGFEVQRIPIGRDIPQNLNALVIGEPLKSYNDDELKRIKNFIDQGGNVLVVGGPKSQELLNPVVESLGITFMKGQLVQRNANFSPDIVFTHTPLLEGGDPYEFQFSSSIAMPAAVGLQYQSAKGFEVRQAIVTDENTTWNKIGEISADTSEVTFQAQNGDDHHELPVALTLTRKVDKKEQRIMVIGNGEFMGNENLQHDYGTVPIANQEFAVSIFKWLSHGKYPLEIKPGASLKDTDLLYAPADFEKYKIYYTWLLPTIALLTGAILLLRRRRK